MEYSQKLNEAGVIETVRLKTENVRFIQGIFLIVLAGTLALNLIYYESKVIFAIDLIALYILAALFVFRKLDMDSIQLLINCLETREDRFKP